MNVVRSKQSGLTLVEIMIVIVVVGVLAAIATTSFRSHTNKARSVEADLKIAKLADFLHLYYKKHNRPFPIQASFVPVKSVIPSQLQEWLPELKGNYFSAKDYTYQCKDGKFFIIRATGKGRAKGVRRQVTTNGKLSDF